MIDSDLIHHVRAFLSADDKPDVLGPLDLLQTIRLLIQKSDEKDTYMSQQTLATQLCSSVDAIKRSQDRLSHLGWLTVRKGGYRGRTNRYAIDLNKLPKGDLNKTVISEEAKRIAFQYGKVVNVQTKKRFMKLWIQQWAFAIQRLANRTDGGTTRLIRILNFALSSPEFVKRAHRGPGALMKDWGRICQAYEMNTGDIVPKAKSNEVETTVSQQNLTAA